MNDRQLDNMLREAAATEASPTFSPSLHERTMARVRRETGNAQAQPGMRRYWIGMAASVAVAAGVAVVISGQSWWSATPVSPVDDGNSRPVIAALAVPNDMATRAARQAQDKIDSLIASADAASLDRDAVRLMDFVVGQLKVVTLPAEPAKDDNGARPL